MYWTRQWQSRPSHIEIRASNPERTKTIEQLQTIRIWWNLKLLHKWDRVAWWRIPQQICQLAMSTRTQTGDTTPLLTQGIQIQAYYSKLLACVTCRHQNHDLILYTPSRRSSGNLPESSGMQENKHFKQTSGQASGILPVSSGTAEIMKNKKQASEQASGNLPEPSGTATKL